MVLEPLGPSQAHFSQRVALVAYPMLFIENQSQVVGNPSNNHSDLESLKS